MSKVEFCPCEDVGCEFHPSNHQEGCTLCVKDSLKNKELPKCFFKEAGGNLDEIQDWSFEGFVQMIKK